MPATVRRKVLSLNSAAAAARARGLVPAWLASTSTGSWCQGALPSFGGARQVLAVLGDSRSVSRARLHPPALARSPAAEDTHAHPVAVVGQEASCPLAEKQRPATDDALADRLDAADACHVEFLPIPRLRRQSELHTPEALLPLLLLPGLRNHLLRLVGGNLLVPEKGHRVVAPATGQGRERL